MHENCLYILDTQQKFSCLYLHAQLFLKFKFLFVFHFPFSFPLSEYITLGSIHFVCNLQCTFNHWGGRG